MAAVAWRLFHSSTYTLHHASQLTAATGFTRNLTYVDQTTMKPANQGMRKFSGEK